MSEITRIYVTGSCDGLDRLREGLAEHPELDFVGWSENVAEASAALAGGHLQVVVHATRSATFPADDVAAIREHTRSPIVILASGEASALLEEALDAEGVADVLLLPQLTENVVFALRKAGHAGRRLAAEGGHARQGRIITVFSPKGGTGKTVTATNLAASFAKHEGRRTLLLDLDLQFGDAAIMLGLEPDKTIYDLVVAPGELDSEKLAGYITKHTCGLDILPAPLRPEDAELVTETKLARLLEASGEGTLRPPVEAAMGMMGGGVLDNDDPALDSDRVYYYKMDYIRSLSHSTGVIAVSCGRRQRGMLPLVRSQERRLHLTCPSRLGLFLLPSLLTPYSFRIQIWLRPPSIMDDSIPSISTGSVGSRFVSSNDIETAKARRDEQWKAAYARQACSWRY